MDEHLNQPTTPTGERPMVHPSGAGAQGGVAAPLADPRALTILTTEHWSLLSARALVYNEAFARGGMFLSFLAATLVALGLMSGAMGFTRELLTTAALVLCLDLFIGFATMGRVSTATSEDVRLLQGMNRLRHAYHETVPGLEPYFSSGHHDDVRGVFDTYGADVQLRSRRSVMHGFTTVVGMIGVINAAISGVLAGIVTVLVTDDGPLAVGVALAVFLLVLVLAVNFMTTAIASTVAGMEARFPTPTEG